ncbi:MAG TPA: helix-turn-helix domain-containing protein [Microlunatus sp.]
MQHRAQQPDQVVPLPRLWTVSETAAFLSVPSSTLYYWSYLGEGGPPILRIGRSLRYDPRAVMAWAMSQAA